jgi:biopolymer transport protein ExbD
MARSVSARESAPLSAINMTPFIDILLVLIIMLILTVPIANHKLAIDLPAKDPGVPVEPHVLALDAAGGLYWNGQRIRDEQLPGLAKAAAAADVPLAIRPDLDTRYERFNTVLATVRREGVTKLGFTSAGEVNF